MGDEKMKRWIPTNTGCMVGADDDARTTYYETDDVADLARRVLNNMTIDKWDEEHQEVVAELEEIAENKKR